MKYLASGGGAAGLSNGCGKRRMSSQTLAARGSVPPVGLHVNEKDSVVLVGSLAGTGV